MIQWPEWTRRSACRDHDPKLWDGDTLTDQIEARRICRGCPVLIDCLTQHLNEEYGVYGGLDPRDRGNLLEELNARPELQAPHGTRSRYIGSTRHPGCRCNACTTAHAKYEHERRAQRKAERRARTTPNQARSTA